MPEVLEVNWKYKECPILSIPSDVQYSPLVFLLVESRQGWNELMNGAEAQFFLRFRVFIERHERVSLGRRRDQRPQDRVRGVAIIEQRPNVDAIFGRADRPFKLAIPERRCLHRRARASGW